MTFIYFFIFNHTSFFLTFIPIYYNITLHVITELLRGFLYHLHVSAAYIPPFNVIEVFQNVRGGGGPGEGPQFFFFVFVFLPFWVVFLFLLLFVFIKREKKLPSYF